MTSQNRIKDVDILQEEINKYRPLSPHAVKQLKEYYRIGLTYTSNAIEGNSLTETETKIILEDGITIGGKSIKEHQEAIGHSEAYDLLYTLSKYKTITEKDIKKLHRIFYYRIDESNAGDYRKAAVFISGTDYIPPQPEKVPALMKQLSEQIPTMREKYHPVEYSALLHGDFVTIHPFVDGNGRTARLLMNLALLQESYVITLIPPILRAEYINTLKDYNKGKTKAFINFISAMVYESQKDYLRLLEALSGGKNKTKEHK
jgi:Fic family protein